MIRGQKGIFSSFLSDLFDYFEWNGFGNGRIKLSEMNQMKSGENKQSKTQSTADLEEENLPQQMFPFHFSYATMLTIFLFSGFPIFPNCAWPMTLGRRLHKIRGRLFQWTIWNKRTPAGASRFPIFCEPAEKRNGEFVCWQIQAPILSVRPWKCGKLCGNCCAPNRGARGRGDPTAPPTFSHQKLRLPRPDFHGRGCSRGFRWPPRVWSRIRHNQWFAAPVDAVVRRRWSAIFSQRPTEIETEIEIDAASSKPAQQQCNLRERSTDLMYLLRITQKQPTESH